MNFKSPGIRERSQYFSILYDMANGPPVVLLVKKIAGFLSILKIHMELQPVFIDNDPRIKGGREEPFLLRQTFQLPDRHIVALINAFGLENVVESLDDGGFPGIHAEGKGLDDEMVIELVNDQLGQPVCFAKNKPAILPVAQFLPVFPAGPYAVQEELVSDLFVLIPGQKPDKDLGPGIDIAFTDKLPVMGKYGDYFAATGFPFNFIDLIVKDPGMTIDHTGGDFSLQEDTIHKGAKIRQKRLANGLRQPAFDFQFPPVAPPPTGDPGSSFPNGHFVSPPGLGNILDNLTFADNF